MSASTINRYPVTPLWYKKRVRLLFTNFFLPFLAAVEVVVLVTPYFHHHLRLTCIIILLIFVLAGIPALKIQKSEKEEKAALVEKADFIKQTYDAIRSQQSKDEAEKQRKQTLRQDLAKLLTRGRKIGEDLVYNNPQASNDKENWEKEVIEYLSKNAELSYAHRFLGINQAIDITTPDSRRRTVVIGEMQARVSMLNDFISELHD